MANLTTKNQGYPLTTGNLIVDRPLIDEALNKIDQDIAEQKAKVTALEGNKPSLAKSRLVTRHPHLGSILNGNT